MAAEARLASCVVVRRPIWDDVIAAKLRACQGLELHRIQGGDFTVGEAADLGGQQRQ